jgi:hypothetical protein
MRPYRHVPTAELQHRHEVVFVEVQWHVKNGFNLIVKPYRRELRRLARELDCRAANERMTS